DVEALFPQVPVGTKVYIVNEPVKVAFVDGELLLEVHPPIDAEGQTIEPNLDQFSAMLDQALGQTTAAVHWDFARETLQTANGFPTVVGLEADLDTTPEPLPEVAPNAESGAPVAEGTSPAQSGAPPAEGTSPTESGTRVAEGTPAARSGSASDGAQTPPPA